MKKIILALLATTVLAACSDSFLDTESMTESNTQTFYRTEADAQRAIIGCYAAWRETTSAGDVPIYMTSMMMSDECFAGAGQADACNYDNIDKFDMAFAPSYTNMWGADWRRYYAAIYRCNELIAHADGIAWNSDDTRQCITGEAYALRGALYLDLLRMFENVPLLTTATSDNVPQADPLDVAALIVSDLKTAADAIPANAYPKAASASNEGHLTRYGAKALLARTYLYCTGRFGTEPQGCDKAEALQAAEDVINSGEFELVPLYRNLWPAAASAPIDKDTNATYEDWLLNAGKDYAGAGNKELVVTMKCNDTQDYNNNNDGNRWIINIGIRGAQTLGFSPYGWGWGICTVNPELYKAYPDGDQRRDASIIACKEEGLDKNADFKTKCIDDQRQYTGYYIKKYSPLATTSCESLPIVWKAPGDFMTAQYQDVAVVRYSDVLLMAAELGSPQAQTYFNQVRERAYRLPDGSLDSHYKPLEATRDNILNERRLELAFEGVRMYDLMRTGIEATADAIATNQTVLSGGLTDQVTITRDNVIRKNGLCQIPKDEITKSNYVLKQNAGW